MLLVAVAWIYVVLMIAVVEATGPSGTLPGAAVTVLLYGVLPLGILGYLFFSPARRRARRLADARPVVSSAERRTDPDEPGHAPRAAIAPEREEP